MTTILYNSIHIYIYTCIQFCNFSSNTYHNIPKLSVSTFLHHCCWSEWFKQCHQYIPKNIASTVALKLWEGNRFPFSASPHCPYKHFMAQDGSSQKTQLCRNESCHPQYRTAKTVMQEHGKHARHFTVQVTAYLLIGAVFHTWSGLQQNILMLPATCKRDGQRGYMEGEWRPWRACPDFMPVS